MQINNQTSCMSCSFYPVIETYKSLASSSIWGAAAGSLIGTAVLVSSSLAAGLRAKQDTKVSAFDALTSVATNIGMFLSGAAEVMGGLKAASLVAITFFGQRDPEDISSLVPESRQVKVMRSFTSGGAVLGLGAKTLEMGVHNSIDCLASLNVSSCTNSIYEAGDSFVNSLFNLDIYQWLQ